MPAQDRVQAHPDSDPAELRADVRAGLMAEPKSLPPKYFYDERGSELFEEITRLPEYYPARAETAILRARAGEIAELSRCESLVESAAAPRPRPACCCGRSAKVAPCASSCRSTSIPRSSPMRQRR